MLRTKEDLALYIERHVPNIAKDQDKLMKCMAAMKEKYNIPNSIATNILTLRTDPVDEPDFILYATAETINPDIIKIYFSNTEIETYSNEKYEIQNIKFPLVIPMIQISDDQWIGSTSAKLLMKLGDAQLIRYNQDTQRTPERFVRGGVEYYRATINRGAVNAICESYDNGTYIPNTITLNMPEETDFYYDEDTRTLHIRSIDAFDIIDGYHRYLAMQMKYRRKRFDYPMELRIVCFAAQKAKQFIWQEDQKTKMTKVDSDSMNQNSVANQIVGMLNQSGMFAGLINNTTGIIDPGTLAKSIEKCYFKDVKKKNRAYMIQVRKQVLDAFTTLVEDDPKILDKRWNTKRIVYSVFCSAEDPENVVAGVSKLLADNSIVLVGRNIEQRDISRIRKAYGMEE